MKNKTIISSIQNYFTLFSLALIPIYIGSFRSLTQKTIKRITSEYAYFFPLIVSFTLFSIYLVFKFLPTYWVNFVLSFYFMLLGIGSITSVLNPILENILPCGLIKEKPRHFKIKFPFFGIF
jgi:minor histocompatibility antigen H13